MERVLKHLDSCVAQVCAKTGKSFGDVVADVMRVKDSGLSIAWWLSEAFPAMMPADTQPDLYKKRLGEAYEVFVGLVAMTFNLATSGKIDEADAVLGRANQYGGYYIALMSEKKREKRSGSVNGKKKKAPQDRLKHTHDVFWRHRRSGLNVGQARIQTGVDIANEDGRSKPYSGGAIKKQLEQYDKRK